MILSKKILKIVEESKQPCQTQTVVLKQSPVKPLNRTALFDFYIDFRRLVYMMLALMLLFFIVEIGDRVRDKQMVVNKSSVSKRLAEFEDATLGRKQRSLETIDIGS